MAANSALAHAWGDVTNAVLTSPIGAAAPTTPLPTAAPAGYYDLGWLSDQGITESKTFNEVKKYGWQGGGLIRVLRNQFENPFKFQCLEENAAVIGIMRPGQAVTTVAGTAEVQTVTMTGTGTAGTFSLTLPGYGTATGLAYNITTSALATALQSAFGIAGITVPSGTPGTTYTVNFGTSAGNVPQMTSINSITGVSAITNATTTPGTAAVSTQSVGTSATRNLRQWIIDMVDGSVHKRIYIPSAEAVLTGDISYSNTDITAYEFTLNPYIVGGRFYDVITDDPAYAGTFV